MCLQCFLWVLVLPQHVRYMSKQTLLISSAGLFPVPCCITPEETGLAAAGGMSAFQAGCFMPQRFPFLLVLLMPAFAKLEWANTCC